MITLPKDWANSVGLEKNDTVRLQAQPDGTLSLFPKGTAPVPKRSTKVIDVTSLNDREFLHRQLVGAYIAGHATILVKSEQMMPNSAVSVVNSFVQTTIGLELIESDDSHMLIANLIEHDAIDPKKTIERMGLLVKNMVNNLYDAAFTGNLDSIRDIRSRDTEVDRIYWLTSRQCNIYQKDAAAHKMNLPLHEMSACLSLSRVLEGIGDHAVSISDCLFSIAKNGNTYVADRDAHRLGQRLNDLLSKAVKSWTEKDMILAELSIKEAEEIIKDANRMAGAAKGSNNGSALIHDVMTFSSKTISEYCKNIAEYAFDMVME
jgi:phosphate uptake regulator